MGTNSEPAASTGERLKADEGAVNTKYQAKLGYSCLANHCYGTFMTRGNEKFIRRQKEVERQKAQEEKRQKRAQRKREGGADAGDDDVAAIQAALDAGVDPRTLNTGAEAGAEDQPASDEAADKDE